MSDIINIICPKCGKTHVYDLEVVHRSSISYVPGGGLLGRLIGLFMNAKEGNTISKAPDNFTRLFTCPIKNEDFQVTAARDKATKQLKAVTINGVSVKKE